MINCYIQSIRDTKNIVIVSKFFYYIKRTFIDVIDNLCLKALSQF